MQQSVSKRLLHITYCSASPGPGVHGTFFSHLFISIKTNIRLLRRIHVFIATKKIRYMAYDKDKRRALCTHSDPSLMIKPKTSLSAFYGKWHFCVAHFIRCFAGNSCILIFCNGNVSPGMSWTNEKIFHFCNIENFREYYHRGIELTTGSVWQSAA